MTLPTHSCLGDFGLLYMVKSSRKQKCTVHTQLLENVWLKHLYINIKKIQNMFSFYQFQIKSFNVQPTCGIVFAFATSGDPDDQPAHLPNLN